MQTMELRDGLERVLEGNRIVGGDERLVIAEVDLMLADRNLVVRGLDVDPHVLQSVDHLLANGDRQIGGQIEIAAAIVWKRQLLPAATGNQQEEFQLRTREV